MRTDEEERLWDASGEERLAWLKLHDPEMADVVMQLVRDAETYRLRIEGK
jgi:hypothetical protein